MQRKEQSLKSKKSSLLAKQSKPKQDQVNNDRLIDKPKNTLHYQLVNQLEANNLYKNSSTENQSILNNLNQIVNTTQTYYINDKDTHQVELIFKTKRPQDKVEKMLFLNDLKSYNNDLNLNKKKHVKEILTSLQNNYYVAQRQ